MKESSERENERIKENEAAESFSHSDFGNLGFGKLGFGEEKDDFKGFEHTAEEKENGGFGSFREPKEDFVFSEKEEKKDEKAWYEDSAEARDRSNKASDEFLKEQKSEHRVHAMLEEHAKHSHVYTEKEREKAVSELDGASEKIEEREKKESSFQDGKIYLPKEKPLFESDSIENPREYIARNFGRNASVERMKGKSKPAFIILGVCFAFIALFSRMLSVYIAVVFTVLAAIFVFSGKPKNPSFLKKPEEFFLIKPYAIEKMAKSLSVSYALDLYYRIKGEARKAVTAAVYTEEQIDILTEAFLKGELVVACRIADRKGEPDTAVVCSPDPY